MKPLRLPVVICLIVVAAFAIGALFIRETSRPLRNEYSFAIRQVANPATNVLFPTRDEIDVVTTVNGAEVFRADVAGGAGCSVLEKKNFVFEDSISEVSCSFEGGTDLYVMRETEGDATVVDQYGLADVIVDSPTAENYELTGRIFEGNNDASSEIVSLERDPYDGWETVEFEGVISMRLAPGCLRGLDETHIICPTDENDQPLPEMTVRMVGDVLEIRRWEGLSSVYWDQMVASIQFLAPLKQDVQIFIEK